METYNGVLSLRLMNEGSKSEAVYAYLTLDSGEEYILYRKDNFPADDDYFVPFKGKAVQVLGEVEDEYMVVEELQLLTSSLAPKCQNCQQKKRATCAPNNRRAKTVTLYDLMRNR